MAATVTSAVADLERARIELAVSYAGFAYARVWRYVGNKPPVKLRNIDNNGTILPPTYDYEAPLEKNLGYAATGWNDPDPEPPAPPRAQVTTGLDVVDTETWLKVIAEPALNRRLDCVAVLPSRQFQGNVGLFRILGAEYPVAVHDVMTSWAGSIVWVEPNGASYDAVEAILRSGAPLLLQTGAKYGSIHEYIQPQGFTSQHTQNANMPQRYVSLQFVTVASPVGDQKLQADYTHQDVYDDWTTFEDVLGAFTDYYALLRGDSQ